MVELKLREVIERAHLSQWTAQYVLKHPELLPGMPEAGSQGKHRVFSYEQAFQFALAALLVQTHVPLKYAMPVLKYCESRERELCPHRPDSERAFTGVHSRTQWTLRIADGEYMSLAWESSKVPKENRWCSVEDGVFHAEIRTPLVVASINLTQLVRQLTSTKR